MALAEIAMANADLGSASVAFCSARWPLVGRRLLPEETTRTAHAVGVAQAGGMPLDVLAQAGFRDLQSP
jgi:hypothetical protein